MDYKHSEETKIKMSESHKGKQSGAAGKHWKLSKKQRQNYIINKKGKKNPMWKGDGVGNSALHEWIRNHKPKSIFCEKCGKTSNRLDCANISGKYKRNIDDYEWLCRGYHMKEDGRLKKRCDDFIKNKPWKKFGFKKGHKHYPKKGDIK